MALTIRQYQDTDLKLVLDSWEKASTLAHPFLTSEFQAKVRHDIPNIYLPNADTWVAEQDGTVIGFISLLGHEVGALFVEPNHHGKGAGKALVDKAVEIYQNIELEVFKDNPIGRKFYAGYGFKPIAETKHAETGHPVLRLKYTA